MSNIALIGASGRIGTKITQELRRRGHSVTAIVRNPEKVPAQEGVTVKAGDFTQPESIAPILQGHDAIISAATFIPGQAENLISAVRGSGVKRFLMVGGAASLKTEDGRKVYDTIQLPEEWKAPVQEGMRTLGLLREVNDLDWTFFSPAVMIQPGERTGKFRLGKEEVVKDAEGKSTISFDDYAIAMVDELEQPQNIKARFTIGY
jgi:putative NADH-flavin reductase